MPKNKGKRGKPGKPGKGDRVRRPGPPDDMYAGPSGKIRNIGLSLRAIIQCFFYYDDHASCRKRCCLELKFIIFSQLSYS